MYNLSRFCCQNPKCADYGKRGAGNLMRQQAVWKGKDAEASVLPHVQEAVFGAQRNGVFWVPSSRQEDGRDFGSSGRGLRGAQDGPSDGKEPQRGRPRSPCTIPRPDLHYAIVHKTRKNGRVVRVEPRVIFGNPDDMLALLARSPVSRKVNTAFVERNNGTDRNRNARKVRRTYCFSKDWDIHERFTYFTYYSYNFCWPVRTLRCADETGHWHDRTPAMSAALADHVWSLAEWLSFPSVQQS